MRVWDMGGSSTKNLDYSERNGNGSTAGGELSQEPQIDPVRRHKTATSVTVFYFSVWWQVLNVLVCFRKCK